MPVTIKTSAMKYKNPDTGQYEGVDMIEEKAVRDIVADDYSPTSPYAVDAYCLYNGDYYRCTTAIQSGEAWNASHWTPTQVSDELVSIKGAVDSIGTNEVANESNVSGATATAALNTLSGAIETYFPTTAFTDLNALPTGVLIGTFGNNTSNAPTTSSGTVWHYASSASYACQIVQSNSSYGVWRRYKSGGTWSQWQQIDASPPAPENGAFVVTGTTLASKTNEVFCTSSASSKITSSTKIASVTFLDPTVVISSTFTATPGANGTVTLSGSTGAGTTTAFILCQN